MLWVKALHIISVICWFAGIFYLPRLFVYHAMSDNQATRDQFKIMERKLYRFITPFAILSVVFGGILMMNFPIALWIIIKSALVALLLVYHFYCGHLVNVFAADNNTRTHKWYRWFNELPVILLFAIVFLVVYKPT